jgi:hypothetical protein
MDKSILNATSKNSRENDGKMELAFTEVSKEIDHGIGAIK